MAKKLVKKKEVKSEEKKALELFFDTNAPLIEEAASILKQTPTEYVNGVVAKNANAIVKMHKAKLTGEAKEAPPAVVVAPVVLESAPKPVPAPVVEAKKSLPVLQKKKIAHPCRFFNKNGVDPRFLKAEYNGTCALKGNVACFWPIHQARNCPTFNPVPGYGT